MCGQWQWRYGNLLSIIKCYPLPSCPFLLSTHSPLYPPPLICFREVLEKVEGGYRMPKPDSCPDALFNIMLSTWNHEAEKRPTFEYLKSTLEDYYVSAAEGAYKEAANI